MRQQCERLDTWARWGVFDSLVSVRLLASSGDLRETVWRKIDFHFQSFSKEHMKCKHQVCAFWTAEQSTGVFFIKMLSAGFYWQFNLCSVVSCCVYSVAPEQVTWSSPAQRMDWSLSAVQWMEWLSVSLRTTKEHRLPPSSLLTQRSAQPWSFNQLTQ